MKEVMIMAPEKKLRILIEDLPEGKKIK